MYYDVVKSTYKTSECTTRIDSMLVAGSYFKEHEACKKARELIIGNNLEENEFYEVEQHNDDGSLEMIIEP